MNCFIIKVSEPPRKLIHVHPISGTNIKVSEISSASLKVYSVTDPKISKTTLTNYSAPNIQLSECIAQLPSDFNDRVFAVTSGLIPLQTFTSLIGISGVSVKKNNTDYTVSLSAKQYRSINSSYFIQPNDDFIFVDTSLADIVVSLPSASNLGGKQLNIKKKSGNHKLIIQSLGSETIDSSNSFIIYNNYQSIALVSDNSNWLII